jgi:hypothetical protein
MLVSMYVLAPILFIGEARADAQRCSQYIDAESGVVKRPEREGWTDPYGDGVWRSSWFYASLLVIRAKDPGVYDRLRTEHGVSTDQAGLFLAYFRDHCTGGDEWKLPKNDSQKFSRDQLAPLLYLLACVHAYAPEHETVAKDIVTRLIALDKSEGAVSDSPQGKVRDNLRYCIDVVAHLYGVHYVSGAMRGLYKVEFGAALKADSLLVQVPADRLATMDDYSVFNSLALVTLQGVAWGKDDGDVKDWRANYRQHADKGWGPAFRIVSGRSIDDASINNYYTMRMGRSQDNDIILAQRPSKYLKGIFPPTSGDWLVLDYVILKGLRLAWQ